MNTEHRTIRLVITFLGTVAVLLTVGALFLVYKVLDTPKIDTAAVAVLGSITGLAGTAIGALGSMLVSTRGSTPSAGDPTTVVADPNATVSVTPPPDDGTTGAADDVPPPPDDSAAADAPADEGSTLADDAAAEDPAPTPPDDYVEPTDPAPVTPPVKGRRKAPAPR